MNNFTFFNPTKIIFGKNKVGEIGYYASKYGKKALLVYGRNSIKTNGVYDTVIESLKKNNIEWIEHPGVKPNPILSHTIEGIKKARENKCEFVIAVGGGSVIDESKAIAAGFFYNGDVWDFFVNKAKIENALPVLTVLTIPATGSEMNSGFVITNEKTQQKYSAHSPFSFPKVSILDPQTTYTLPLEQSAYGASDAIAHLLEGYLTTNDFDCEITDNIVFAVFKSIKNSTERILKDPKDYNARASMMWSATLALNGLQSLGYKNVQWPNHAIEHSLSAIYDIPHGLGLAIIVPAYMKFMLKKGKTERIEKLGKEIFSVKDAKTACEEFEKWLKNIGLKTKLSEINIPEKDIPSITQNAMGMIKIWQMTYTEKDVMEILELAK